MLRVAGAADLHFGPGSEGTLRPFLDDLPRNADVFLLAGDLTQTGKVEEARLLAQELSDIEIPTVAVLGNHDYHNRAEADITALMESTGVEVLEGDSLVYDFDGMRVGIVGSKGFGGGFGGACATDFGEPEIKRFIRHTCEMADKVGAALDSLDTDFKILLLHFSPIRDTLVGEPMEIYPFLGSYLFAEAADRTGADLIIHGHAHRGTEKGETPGGIPVRNVAHPVIGRAYALYDVIHRKTVSETARVF